VACARATAKAINTCEIISEASWSERFPQSEDETAVSRLDALSDYRVARVLANQVRALKGHFTKLFGLKFLLATKAWPDHLQRIRTELASTLIPASTVDAFLEGWDKVVSGADSSLASLVWAKDFKGALEARNAQRAEEVRRRNERMAHSQSEYEELKSALASTGEC
jgi:hypothetical protein